MVTSGKTPSKVASRALIVLGMHRSGTSAYARFINLLGAKLPSRLIEPNFANESGFWEPQEGAELNDWFLDQIGSKWNDTSTIPLEAFESDAAHIVVSKIEDFLAREFTGAATFVLKDPRNTRLAPLWIRALKSFGAEPTFIVPIRNPVEVARSLVARDGMSEGQALLLWLRCTLDAERGSRNFRRSFVRYDSLLTNWKDVANKIAKDCGFTWPIRLAQAKSDIDAFLDPNRRHQRASDDGISDLPEWYQLAYRDLLAATEGQPVDSEALDALSAQLDRADSVYAPYIWHLNSVQARLSQSLEHSAAKLHELDQASAALHDREGRLQQLQQEYELLRGGLDTAHGRIDEISRERDSAVSAHSTLEADHTALRGHYDGLHKQAAGLVHDLNRTKQEASDRDALQAHASQALEKRVEYLTDQLAASEAALEAVRRSEQAAMARATQAAEALAEFKGLPAQTTSQDGVVQTLRTENEALEKRLAQFGSDAIRLETILREAEVDIQYTAGRLRESQKRVQEQERQLAHLEQNSHQLQLVLRSRSWFLTKPFRVLTRLAGRVRRRLALTRSSN
jgi:hypothetical protein